MVAEVSVWGTREEEVANVSGLEKSLVGTKEEAAKLSLGEGARWRTSCSGEMVCWRIKVKSGWQSD